jgi:hypothetical protein
VPLAGYNCASKIVSVFDPGGQVHFALSLAWMLVLALFIVDQLRFWSQKVPLAISIAAWLLYVALVYLRIVP